MCNRSKSHVACIDRGVKNSTRRDSCTLIGPNFKCTRSTATISSVNPLGTQLILFRLRSLSRFNSVTITAAFYKTYKIVETFLIKMQFISFVLL